MTVSYHLELASVSPLSFLGVLLRWKGSVWKHVFKELLIWTAAYLAISFVYRSRYFLNTEQKLVFENVAYYFDTRLKYIPLTFILGFFVNTILSRWSDIFNNMGYIESYAICIGNYIRGEDQETRWLRRSLVRYLCLTQVLVFRDISIRVRKRFPTINSIIDAGILLEEEKEKLDSIKLHYNKYWAPIRWIHAIALQARKDGKISHDLMYSKLCDEINKFRYNLQLLCNYDWVPLPLVYSQAVFLAVYVHFGVCLISRQYIVDDSNGSNKVNASITSEVDLLLPVMTMIQFVFFIGWLKVAQALLNPFGDDDDDFECNYLIDKNLATSLCIADNYDRVPEVQPDRFWRHREQLPLSTETPLVGSAVNAKLDLTEEQSRMVVRRPSQMPPPAFSNFGRRKSRLMLHPRQESKELRRNSHAVISRVGVRRPTMRERSASSVCIGALSHNKLEAGHISSRKDHLLRTAIYNLQNNDRESSRSEECNTLDAVNFVPPDPAPTNTALHITKL